MHELKFIALINGFFMNEFMEIKMGFNKSLHKKISKPWISIDIVDKLLHIWTSKLESDHLKNL